MKSDISEQGIIHMQSHFLRSGGISRLGVFKALAGASVLALLAATTAHAGPVQGNVVADNHAVVVLEQTAGNFTVISGSASSWPTPANNFSFNIRDFTEAEARQCKIHVIAWGDGSTAQGVAAVFKGAMTVMTPTGFTMSVKANSATGGAFPATPGALTVAQAAAIIPGAVPAPTP